MKKLFLIMLVLVCFNSQAQINKEELSLKISKAEEANTKGLQEYMWKRKSDVSLDGVKKLTTFTEFSFNAEGKLEAKLVDAQSDVKQKPGLRGKAQENAIGAKADYVEKALGLALKYSFMSKGELLDFFSKATVTDKGATLEATADNVYVQGDKLLVVVDSKTNLFKFKKFSSFLGKDPVDGELNYESFSTGISHGTTTVLNMPAQKMKIDAVNQDYSKRVK
jgi:hypothetical protein